MLADINLEIRVSRKFGVFKILLYFLKISLQLDVNPDFRNAS